MRNPESTFRTKRGTCTITELEIILAREGIPGVAGRDFFGDWLVHALAISGLISVIAMAHGVSLLADADYFSGSLSFVLGAIGLWNFIMSRKCSATPVVQRSAIREVQVHPPRPPLTRGYFTVYFEERGKERKRLIMLPGSWNNGAEEFLRAVAIMRDAGLLKSKPMLSAQEG
ncbi:MAG: hypothetical protein JKY61_09580 [Planctomycetes bacterium]|nr:hypothetical protein [Planctomycetota bacterium]